jgi:Fur family ferric uptake transcriptional regulator
VRADLPLKERIAFPQRKLAMTEVQQIFHQHLRRTGNHITSQRDLVLKTVMAIGGHLTAEEIYQQAKKDDPMLGFTTVYRALKLLVEAGIAREEKFNDGSARYEYGYKREHHDHLICTQCNAVMEFFSEGLEAEQEKVLSKFAFRATHHSLRIFGICHPCQSQKTHPQNKTR